MYRQLSVTVFLSIALGVLLASNFVNATSVCSGYPLTYNGLPCASTTRYWDGQMGACGCGTGDSDPYSWQWEKYTAAASPPIFGSGTWCGTGCGKCFKLTPTAVGASPDGTGATNTSSIVIKVTNLCPPDGNAEWCSYDTNSYGYDAHFDLMDYEMAGAITALGWDNPEVTYEEVDCDSNGFGEWSCECSSYGTTDNSTTAATTAPTTAATTAPTTKSTTKATTAATTKTTTAATSKATTAATTKATTAATTKTTTAATTKATTAAATTKATTAATTKATTAATTKATSKATTAATTAATKTTTAATKAATSAPTAAPETATTAASSGTVSIQVNSGSSAWWFGFSLTSNSSAVVKVEMMDTSAITSWTAMTYQGNEYWNLYSVTAPSQMTLPISLRFTSSNGNVATASNIITSFSGVSVDTGVSL